MIAAGVFLTDVDRFPWKSQSEFCVVRATHKFRSLGFVCSPSFFSLPATCRLYSRGVIFACSRFACSTIPEEKWGTTRSLIYGLSGHFVIIFLLFCFIIFIFIIIIIILYFLEKRMSSPSLCFWSICYWEDDNETWATVAKSRKLAQR